MAKGKAVKRVASALRWIAGMFYALIGANGLLHLKPMPEGTTPAAMAFFAALNASGFMLTLLGMSFLVGGLLLLLDRTAPLGLIVLAPPIVVIPLYNWLLELQPFTSGPFVVAIEVFLVWHYWGRFKSLWRPVERTRASRDTRVGGDEPKRVLEYLLRSKGRSPDVLDRAADDHPGR
jgi:hypothetical protein